MRAALRRALVVLSSIGLIALLPIPAGSIATADDGFHQAVAAVLALPYNPAAQPSGFDGGFAADDYPAAFPLTDLAGGACCLGPVPDQPPLADLAPPFAEFPEGFELIDLESFDGTPLHAFAALRPGAPGVVVMHGFNTNGKYSVVRYAAFLYANGYSVIAPDHRDMGREWARGGSYHPDGTRHGQTLGWKEAQDLLTAAEWLASNGTERIGVLGFSEGAQNTILALGIDHDGVIDAALTFSAPADQSTLAQRSPATTAALLTTVVGNPDLCGYLATVGARPEFSATPNFILRNDSAVDTLDGVIGSGVMAPALHFYTADDTLVPSWNAIALASRTNGIDNQHTVMLASGNHAYFTDRWWTQMAALTWFGHWLDPSGSTGAAPTIARTPGGFAAGDQQIDLDGVSRADGDAELLPRDACPAGAPTGPTASLGVDGGPRHFTLDGRRSYSGWDDHELAGWEIDFGDGSAPVSGTAIASAVTGHRYAPGTYTARLTVIDDTGRSAATTATITATTNGSGGNEASRAHGAGHWGSPGGDEAARFTFQSGQGRPLLRVVDVDAGVLIEAATVGEPVSADGDTCAGLSLSGPGAFSFTATGSFTLDGVATAATFHACGLDGGSPGAGNDLFFVACTAGCGYDTGRHGPVIAGGTIHVHGSLR